MRIGVDLGGTKIEAIVLADDGEIVLRRRINTPAQDYRATVQAISALCRELEAELGFRCSVGVGTPGAPSLLSGLMKNCNSTVLNGKPLAADLSKALGREVRIANDANCFALSEAKDGSAAGSDSVFGVILGTGVGGGWVVHGRLLTGANAIAGEWGHNPLSEAAEKRACYCGRQDCVETYLCGAGLLKTYRQLGGVAATAQEVADSADDLAEQALEQYCQQLARGLAGVINCVDPEVVVLGGGLSNIATLYERVPMLWQQWVFSDDCRTRLVKAQYGDSSGVRGAAWLWPR